MATPFECQWRTCREIEKQINAYLSHNAIPDVTVSLEQYRSACEAAILADFAAASSNAVEERLWSVHIQINSKYRKALGELKKEGNKRVVETRKVSKQYEHFLKSSQRFYRGFVHILNSRFGGIPELERIAQKWTEDVSGSRDRTVFAPELKQKVLVSCHQTLIRLGDLHRYRVTNLSDTDRNWGPAVGFYTLARIIYPASGIPHNQQAVIALADGDNLRATYHLYRAIAAKEPHPSAQGNLEIEFKKIVSAWSKGDLKQKIALQKEGDVNSQALVNWFVLLHAKCYKGVPFPEHDELENEVLSQLTTELQERSNDSLLSKLILIDIASLNVAASRLQGEPHSSELLQAYFFFLRLNVRTFFTLLETFQSGLERHLQGLSVEAGKDLPHKIPATARRILPLLRLYSSWFLTNSAVLAAEVGDDTLQIYVKKLWKSYARTLTLLASAFPADLLHSLPSVDYLLEEDEDTVGFKPLLSKHTLKHWYLDEKLKARIHDVGIERHHPNIEMMTRIRDLLVDGLRLAVDEAMPVDLHDTCFNYRENEAAAEPLATPYTNAAADDPATKKLLNGNTPIQSRLPAGEEVRQGFAPESISLSISRDVDLNRMVDNLVGNEDDFDTDVGQSVENGNFPAIPSIQTVSDTAPLGISSNRTPISRSRSDLAGLECNRTERLIPAPTISVLNSPASPNGYSPHITAGRPLSSIWNKGSPETHRPGTEPRKSPGLVSAFQAEHSRAQSVNSSRTSLPNPNTWSSYYSSPINDHNAGTSDNFGAIGTPRRNSGFVANTPRSTGFGSGANFGHAMGSPLLFGAAGGPWSVNGSHQSSLGMMHIPGEEG